jgi:hypothetical protein
MASILTFPRCRKWQQGKGRNCGMLADGHLRLWLDCRRRNSLYSRPVHYGCGVGVSGAGCSCSGCSCSAFDSSAAALFSSDAVSGAGGGCAASASGAASGSSGGDVTTCESDRLSSESAGCSSADSCSGVGSGSVSDGSVSDGSVSDGSAPGVRGSGCTARSSSCNAPRSVRGSGGGSPGGAPALSAIASADQLLTGPPPLTGRCSVMGPLLTADTGPLRILPVTEPRTGPLVRGPALLSRTERPGS